KIPIDYVKGVEYYTVISLPYSGTYTYRFAAKDRNGVLALGTPTQEYIGPILTGVDAPVAPLLLWTGERNYLYDGLDPEQGEPNSTIFTYRVKYSDGNNEAPLAGYPRVKIKTTGGTEIILPLTRVSPATVTYAAGVLYETRTTLPVPTGVYTYQFEAKDITGLTARGAGIQVKIAPAVNSAPVLSYGGVNPQSGNVGDRYTFSVRYQDSEGHVPYSGYPKVHILIGGVDIPGSPIILPYHHGENISSGRVYYNSLILAYNNSNYSYYFEAMDIYRKMATSTDTYDGPVVTGGVNWRPELLWVGTGGYVSDGLEPEMGTTGTIFTFKVRYRDLNNDLPKPGYPLLHIKKNGNEVATLTMTWFDDTIGTQSCGIYMATMTLQTGSYKYWIEAYENNAANQYVKLPATGDKSGPAVTNAPILTWTGESGFTSDGVDPDYGTVNVTSFTYKVRYYDIDGEEPQYIHLWVYKDDVRMAGSPFPLSLVPGSGPKWDGYYRIVFPCFTEPGTYTYLFNAIGKDGMMCVGSATAGTMTGPIVVIQGSPAPPITPPLNETTTDFNLIDAYNCPNPTYDGITDIVGVLDAAASGLRVIVNIYDIAGDLVWSEEKSGISSTPRNTVHGTKEVVEIEWKGRNDVGKEVANGVYIFRMIISNNEGKTMSKLGKIAVIR
ncbi:MAG: hypothetical protein AB1414_15750, partial [bacterium]